MERLVLTARVAWESSQYVARVDSLSLEGAGESVREAQDELIQAMRGWIESHDSLDTLGRVLAQAGFLGVEEDTELQLEFVD
jgi:hypothetical protein